jgi:hypothetical protein
MHAMLCPFPSSSLLFFPLLGADRSWKWSKALHNDEAHVPNARAFDPTRYASNIQTTFEAAHAADFAQRDHYTFDAGRRSGQGIPPQLPLTYISRFCIHWFCNAGMLSERSIFFAIARLLWTFDIRPAQDDAGNDVVPDADALTDGVLVRPKGFTVVITLQDEKKDKAVRAEWAKGEEYLDQNGQWRRLPEGIFGKEFVPLVG